MTSFIVFIIVEKLIDPLDEIVSNSFHKDSVIIPHPIIRAEFKLTRRGECQTKNAHFMTVNRMSIARTTTTLMFSFSLNFNANVLANV